MGVVEEEWDVGHIGGAEERADEVDEEVGEGDLGENEGVGGADEDHVEHQWGTRCVCPYI